jgi:hypothetical protein
MSACNSKFILHLRYNFEAIHNKDYSVVKTLAFPLALNQGDFLLGAILSPSKKSKKTILPARQLPREG